MLDKSADSTINQIFAKTGKKQDIVVMVIVVSFFMIAVIIRVVGS